MFNFFKKKADVLNHWIAFADGFQIPSTEFYVALETELSARKMPSMEMSRIEFGEGGLLSDKRTYLRMVRERLVFDICAAPFGTGFFFSCRSAEIPLSIKWWQLLLAFLGGLLLTGGLFALFYRFLGLILASLLLIVVYGVILYLLRNAVALGLKDIDTTLIRTPVIGPLYERFLRKETYYRIDSRMCYLDLVTAIVKKLAEDSAAVKGVKLVRQFELGPVLGELYKPVKPQGFPVDAPVPEAARP